ncbi:glycoside hydrolase family 31 protein [Ferdinandcohnia quinoae]|uniref:Glycoside hydrolase family 31 protein n=1 Tax=Fredinandcohnia quinoae TaxID=2918902 RepID=A0AAW5E5M1_9BACI|nr:glycoside hydrolase family 31 protein [Fredinandcohnia sp. SECRCQ15]MCH1626149.1 glycoside hydrolase family 31 protein [Fredinandcohnia sp. SECRCQ15]
MLQDTSFAIHPGQKKMIENTSYQDIGSLHSFKQDHNQFHSICENGQVTIVFYRQDIVRIIMNPFEKPSLKGSPAIVKAPDDVNVLVKEEEAEISLKTDDLVVSISKNPFRVVVSDQEGTLLVRESLKGMGLKHTGEVICYKEMDEADHFYGFGEKSGFLDKRGEKMTMWNTDVYAPHNPETDSLYQSIPYFLTVRNGKAHGIFFDNTYKSTFDLRSSTNEYSFQAEGGQMDYYVFAGPTPKDVLRQYTEITGRMPIPPKWAIGYHQSRYSYETEQEVRELAKTFLEKEIPLDVIHLDIHYMNGYRVFSFDRDRFPSPEKLIKDLKEVGIRVVPIVDPGVKEDSEYSIYQEGVNKDLFCKYIEGNIYFGDVWPGNSAFPDFTKTSTREWWGDKHLFYTDLGIEGIWNDMNEPSVFNETKTMDLKVMHDNDGDPRTHRELHNIYGLLMGQSTYEGMKKNLKGKRPFLLTRAGYSGVQRYAAVWTGDNRSFWEHLQMSLPMVMNLGVSGIPFAGPDVGGFAHDSNGELLARWTQVGAFTPYFRNHSAIGFARQEPWSYGEKYEAIIKKYIQLRYKWLPQLYTLFAEAHETGVPIVRPLMMEYPNDKNTSNLSDQFMLGSNVIIAPIMTPSTTNRVVYLPEGNWVNYWTDDVFEGGKHHMIYADLDTLPIFIKQGTAVVHGDVRQSTEYSNEKMTIHLYNSSYGTFEFSIYDDDGSSFEYQTGHFFRKIIKTECQKNTIHITMVEEGSYRPNWDLIEIEVHNAEDIQTVFVNGKMVESMKRNDNRLLISI